MTQLEALKLSHKIECTQLRMKQALDIAELQDKDKMIDPKVAQIISQFDAATDAIAARIQRLIDAGGLSPDSEAALTAEVTKLQALGKDPEVPVPPTV